MTQRISILTPSFNQVAYLKETAASILSQAGDFELEWIVIDGGSTDGSVDFLRSLNDPRVQWTSEKDRGQSHALNKGLKRASGEVIGWLNSDDLYCQGALQIVAWAFGAKPQAGWLVGQCDIIDAQGEEMRRTLTRYKNCKLVKYNYSSLLMENFISQPAVFFRKSMAKKVGGVDESLHYTMDYDWWLRMGRVEDPLIVPQPLARFRVHGTSKTVTEKRKQFEEDYAVASRYLDSRWGRMRKRLAIEKIVWGYRVMKMLGM